MAAANEHQETEVKDVDPMEVDLSWLFAEQPADTSVAGSPSSPPHGAPGRHRLTPVAEVPPPPAAPLHASAHKAAKVSRIRSLSGEQKGRLLIHAAKQGSVESLRMLLAAGADVEATDGFVWTALFWAVHMGHVEAVRCLLGGGAKVGARDGFQDTPLHWAAVNGHAQVAQLLLASSADPNARDVDGRTPLHLAVGYKATFVALLRAGANMRIRDRFGKTPLYLAKEMDDWSL